MALKRGTDGMSGARSYHAGLAAEAAVERLCPLGPSDLCQALARRGGEIDLIARDGAKVIFIEVKQSATPCDGR
jgi:putative endonuclease